MLQLFVSDELRGRVMSMYTLSFIGLAPIGSLEVGFIGERFSPQIAVAASAVAALACGVILLARLSVIAEAQAARDRAVCRLGQRLGQSMRDADNRTFVLSESSLR
jgi:hypothetical protein